MAAGGLMRRFIVALALACVAMGSSPQPAQTQEADSVRIVRVNDIEMGYRIRGTGEPLLLLHGFGGCGQDWGPFLDRLAAAYRLIIPDLRGHGASTNPANTFTHRQSAVDVYALLDHLGLQRVRAMGVSTGGMTLLHMATSRPERVEAMVLIGATSYFPPEARAIMRAVGKERPAPDQRDLACATRGAAQIRQLQDQFLAFERSYDDMNFTAPYLGTITARTLIVHGDRDEFFPVSIPVEMYRAIPGSALWIVPGGGHVPILGPRTDPFLETALGFLRGPAR
jgi:pimeloyl-ACP methyl ester carboxylesterase